MSDKSKCKDYSVPFYFISGLMTLTLFFVTHLAKVTAEESTIRSTSLGKINERLTAIQDKHSIDILGVYQESNYKFELIMKELLEIKTSIGRINGKIGI